MIDSSMNVLQNQIKQASESMGKFQAEIFHSWIQSHNKTNDRLENTEKKMDQLTKSLMQEKEKTHTMHLAATNYFHQLNQCVKINQENTDTLESFRNYVIDKTSLEPMMSDKMKGITESFKPKTFLIADVYTNPAMPDEEGDRNTKK
jgi:chromosome segregation ATPase